LPSGYGEMAVADRHLATDQQREGIVACSSTDSDVGVGY